MESSEPPVLRTLTEGCLLRIYFGESDRFAGRPLYESLVLAAREQGLAGATVLRGPMGFGASSHLHTAKILRLSDDLPMILEVVDERVRIEAFLPTVKNMMNGGLVTLERVEIVHYGAGHANT